MTKTEAQRRKATCPRPPRTRRAARSGVGVGWSLSPAGRCGPAPGCEAPGAPGASSVQLGPGGCRSQGRERGGLGGLSRAGKGRGLGSPTAAPASALPRGLPSPSPAGCKEGARSAGGYLGQGIGPAVFCLSILQSTKTRPLPWLQEQQGRARRGSGREAGGGSPGWGPGIRAPPQPVPLGGAGRAGPREFSRLLSVAACRNKKPTSKHLLRAGLRIGARRVRR